MFRCSHVSFTEYFHSCWGLKAMLHSSFFYQGNEYHNMNSYILLPLNDGIQDCFPMQFPTYTSILLGVTKELSIKIKKKHTGRKLPQHTAELNIFSNPTEVPRTQVHKIKCKYISNTCLSLQFLNSVSQPFQHSRY